MTATARLRALRLVGFKSFAEKTALEFGPGISAIVGPNGSGKSNLADALRWALGEQGRSLRTRRSEDVIFAGSGTRQATGMADVTLVIDNEDGLLPVDYAEVQLGRRLYRSGENEYLLNRQRIRLRDLVDLLDGASLADNAFLFIGQGMVDQALSLRPDERRPLFEEVAGVRRHERRRRQAEAQLAEAEVNLARVRDILAELRPQARRLAAQAEQQTARRDVGTELAEALVAVARERWTRADRAAASASQALTAARSAADRAMAELHQSEEDAAELVRELDEAAVAERAHRAELERLRARSTELRVSEGRAQAELASLRRESERLQTERRQAEERCVDARRMIALPPPEPPERAHAALAAAESELAAAAGKLDAEGRPRGAFRPFPSDLAGSAAEDAEAVARLRQEAAQAERQAAEQRARADAAAAAREAAERRLGEAAAVLREAAQAEERSEREVEQAHVALEAAEGRRGSLVATAADLSAQVQAMQSRLTAVEARLGGDSGGAVTTAALRHGGRRIADGLEVEPPMRTMLEAALGSAIGAAAVAESVVRELRGQRGLLILDDGGERPSAASSGDSTLGGAAPGGVASQAVEAAVTAGGGRAADAVRRDPHGFVRRLLEYVVWVPELDSALALRTLLPPGWRAVTAAGEVVHADGIVELGRGEGPLALRAERERLASEVEALSSQAVEAGRAADEARRAAEARRAEWLSARRSHDAARAATRGAEERERAEARLAETAAREAGWEHAQRERLDQIARRAAEALAELERRATRRSEARPAGEEPDAERATRDERLAQLRARRETIAAEVEQRDAEHRRAEEERRRAEATLAVEERRLAEIDRELSRLAAAEARSARDVARLAGEVAAARESEKHVEEGLEGLSRIESERRTRLAHIEREAARARERLRAAEERSRSAERDELEARLQLEGVREQLLVELASLGPVGLFALRKEAAGTLEAEDASAEGFQAARSAEASLSGREAGEGGEPAEDDRLGRAFELVLEQVTTAWRATRESRGSDAGWKEGPSSAAVAALRRRYQQLGASNPFAVEEYEQLKQRLDTLEGQRADLEAAVEGTRRLIAELTDLIAERFRATFAALEEAFARQFEQLFAGGDARLALTDPDDLSATGVEILARPPGKKRQPLAMLSGGERALTAVALLFAMLEVRPVPFCVLDEVDAALDEANIARFVAALRGLAERIQFIVITHNRGTIEAADALYGVTIGDDAVSRVISLRLSQAPAELPPWLRPQPAGAPA